ncbi:MAG: aldehyde dehydrogenase [Balneola sp.]|nr:aldehyde dehydrogenase [Balneola sp.]MBO6650594.1 aldehyde dehydrogenase [Balneola sp.]MBO6712627.1 aldehyde dehydrogenase [Balneola sp.]MBO6800879.1 aldehyde dehydrogenase [Balneola sp.]MBO6870552.1 aldehyde dehydrogenase [Balneola sp.]
MKELQAHLDKQKKFFQTGKTKEIAYRIAQLKKLKQLLIDNEQLLIEEVHKDFQKSAFETYVTEIGLVITDINFTLKNIESWTKQQSVSTPIVNFPSKNFIITEPYGSALIIAPWNYPILLSLQPLVGAIAAGNTVILKPSELTPNTSSALEKLLSESFEPEFLKVLLGGVEESSVLVKMDFDYIFFTGSTRVGKIIMREAAERLTPLTLELGGKSPCIVDKTANLEISAKRIAWGKFVNAGQTCVAPDYLLVEESIKDELLIHLKNSIHQLYGNEPKESPDFPRIINDAHFDRLAALMSDGETVIGGESDKEKRYIAPTILNNISLEDKIMQDEIFGPILPVLDYTSVEDCISIINARPRPLALYIFTSDQKLEDHILNAVSFGGGAVNDTIAQLGNHHLSFGGVGASGFGSYHGKSSFDSFSHKKSVMKKPFWPDVPIRYAPYDDLKLGLVKKVLK